MNDRMSNVLFLVHRLPYPPNKGDKVRSYHLLKHLSAKHRVFLGTFLDNPDDERFIGNVKDICPDTYIARLRPSVAKISSLVALLLKQPLSIRYYRNERLQAWVNQTLKENHIDSILVFSSVMTQFVPVMTGKDAPALLIDFVDVDSKKWMQYADKHRWPLSWLYQREGEKMLNFDRAASVRAKKSFFVTEKEAALFEKMAPESIGTTVAMSNGVDTDYFSPHPDRVSPFVNVGRNENEIKLVFTGAMDYWPNIDAVIWFSREILPRLLQPWPQLCFYIVGRSPPHSVRALASQYVFVTGTVPDVRPYLQHANLVLAPLRVARGIQNKILEAMAMGRPVVASRSCAEAIEATSDELIRVSGVSGFVSGIDALLRAPGQAECVGFAARTRVISTYSWDANLACIDPYIDATSQNCEMA